MHRADFFYSRTYTVISHPQSPPCFLLNQLTSTVIYILYIIIFLTQSNYMFVAYIYAKHIPYKAGYLFSNSEKKYLLLDWPGEGGGGSPPSGARISKLLWSIRIDSKEPIPNSARLFSLAGRYDTSIPTQFLAPIGGLKIPAQDWADRYTVWVEARLEGLGLYSPG